MAEALDTLLEERKHKIRSLEDMKEKRVAEGNRSYTADEKEIVKTLQTEITQLDNDIAAAREDERITAEIEAQVATLSAPVDGNHIPKMDPQKRSTSNTAAYPRHFNRACAPKAFSNDRDGHEAAYRSGMWLRAQFLGDDVARRWCDRHGLEHRIMVESVVSKGGALVPDELSQRIIDLREQYGLIRKYGYIEPMGSDTKDITRQTGGLTPYFVAEKSSITASDSSWDTIKLVANKLAILTRMSSELDEDATINMADRFAMDAAKAFAQKEDQCAISGDGTSTYGGIVGIKAKLFDYDGAGTNSAGAVEAVATHNLFSELSMTDLNNLLGVIPAYVYDGDPAWYCSQTCWAQCFQRLALAQGGATAAEAVQGVVKTFMGYPVRVTQAMPTTAGSLDTEIMLLFGDISMCSTFGDRRGIRLARDESRYFDTDEVALKATERFDFVCHDVGDSSTAGPIGALYGNIA